LQNTGYTFDKVGNVVSLNNAATSTVQTYQYDDLYQLTSAIGTSVDGTKPNTYTQTFSYDTIGNMLKKTSVSQKGVSNNTPLDLNYALTFQYTGTLPHAASQIGDWAYTYDANGNTVQKKNVVTTTIPSTQYFWDEENRLMRVQQNGVNTDFIYDAAGTRTVKCSPQGETLYVSEFYQFQNQDVVTKHIFVGNTRIVSKLSKYNNTSSLHKTDYEGSNIYTYHPDHIGTSNFITDMAGNKFEHIEYTPYGETWIDEGSKLNIIGYRFTGKELDTETGLYYYGARYLDPQSSRWMSVDPALAQYMPGSQGNNSLPGMGGVFNPVNMALYHYAGNNPVKYVDPSGLWDERIHYGSREYGGTLQWAQEAYFSGNQAKSISEACNAVDNNLSSTNPLFGQSYHFNTNRFNGGESGKEGDSRIQLSEQHLAKAIEYKKIANNDFASGDLYGAMAFNELALKELGTGLHPLQDVYAHTDGVVEYGRPPGWKQVVGNVWHHLGEKGQYADDPSARPEQLQKTKDATMQYFARYIAAVNS